MGTEGWAWVCAYVTNGWMCLWVDGWMDEFVGGWVDDNGLKNGLQVGGG